MLQPPKLRLESFDNNVNLNGIKVILSDTIHCILVKLNTVVFELIKNNLVLSIKYIGIVDRNNSLYVVINVTHKPIFS